WAGASQSPEIAVAGPAEYHPELVPAVFRLSGRITDQSGEGLSGLPVELAMPGEKLQSVSGTDGSYAFSDVPAGSEYRLACKPPNADHDPADTAFALGIDAAPRMTVDLRTLSRLANVSGTVLLDGRSVEGAMVRLYGQGNDISAVSQPSGAFKVQGVAGGGSAQRLTVSKPGANAVDTTLEIETGQVVTGLVLNLKTLKLDVSVILKDSEGKPLARTGVAAAHSGKVENRTTDASGSLVLAGVSGNQTLVLATDLDKGRYGNAELAVSLGERDTSVA